MDKAAAQFRREECRTAVLGYLAERPAVAHHANTIRRSLNANYQGDWTEQEITDALAFQVSAEHVTEVPHPLGATKFYQITADGTIIHERGGPL